MITASGIGSGIDVEGIISQLMDLERAPVRAIQTRQQNLDVQLSAFGSLKSALNELDSVTDALADASDFSPFESVSSDEAVFSATASGTSAALGTYNVEVVSLANTMRITGGVTYASADTTVETGTWTFEGRQGTADATSFNIATGPGVSTVSELKDAINADPANDFVTASLLTTDIGTQLVLTAKQSGTGEIIDISDPSANAPTVLTAASDSVIRIDGLTVTSDSNTVTGALDGITLELNGVGTASVETTRDSVALRDQLDAFVSGYNALRSRIEEFAESTLQGDRLLRDIESRLRNVFFSTIVSDGTSFSPLDIGFTFDREGTLSLDEARLTEAQQGGLDRFVDIFAQADTGFGALMGAAIEQFTDIDGIIETREDGLDTRRESYELQIERYEFRLEQIESRYRRQFGAMDQLVGQLQSTGAFLEQRLG